MMLKLAVFAVVLFSQSCLAGGVDDIYCGGFSDVLRDDPYCPHIIWARDHVVMYGCGGGQFCPDAPVSRRSLAAILHRLSGTLRCRVDMCDTDGAGNVRCRDIACEIYLDP